jgi:23S rRNA (adenine2503-C2)-methyltransferase
MQIEKKDIRAYLRNYYVNFLLPMGTKLRESSRMAMEQGAHSFEDMTNISKETRDVRSNFVINHIKVDTIQRSDDGTIKKCSSFA